MRNIFKGLLGAAALATIVGAPAMAQVAVPITDGGGWNVFYFLSPGSNLQDLSGDTLDFTFSLANPDVLRITDAYQGGDQFQLTVTNTDTMKSTLEAPTTAVSIGGAYVGDCWTCAYFTPAYADQYTRGAYILAAGDYSVSGIAVQSPQFDGAGALELGAIPEPSTWAMMLTGFYGLGAALRMGRRRRAAVAA